MKLFKSTSIALFAGLFILLSSCGGDNSDGSADGEGGASDEVTVMTTEEFIAAANEMTQEEFDAKYPADSEIELKGKVMAPATWEDKVVAKFGTGLNDLPLSADFMFEANGGSKDATKEKVKGGEEVHFKGKLSSSFYNDEGFRRASFKDCVAQ